MSHSFVPVGQSKLDIQEKLVSSSTMEENQYTSFADKVLATPAVRRIAMENNVSFIIMAIHILRREHTLMAALSMLIYCLMHMMEKSVLCSFLYI